MERLILFRVFIIPLLILFFYFIKKLFHFKYMVQRIVSKKA